MGTVKNLDRKHYIDNDDIANKLDEIAEILSSNEANPYRISAYHTAAKFVRTFKGSIAKYVQKYGAERLAKFPSIGKSLATTITTLGKGKKLGYLSILRTEAEPETFLARIPTIGSKLAAKLHQKYNINSVFDLQRLVKKGKLKYFEGIGPKRESAIRNFFDHDFGQNEAGKQNQKAGTLLTFDRMYRSKVKDDLLPKDHPEINAPGNQNSEKYNRQPIWKFCEDGKNFTIQFSDSHRARLLNKTSDWVLLHLDTPSESYRWTVITSQFGSLKGKRIVLGREGDCVKFYSRDGLALN